MCECNIRRATLHPGSQRRGRVAPVVTAPLPRRDGGGEGGGGGGGSQRVAGGRLGDQSGERGGRRQSLRRGACAGASCRRQSRAPRTWAEATSAAGPRNVRGVIDDGRATHAHRSTRTRRCGVFCIIFFFFASRARREEKRGGAVDGVLLSLHFKEKPVYEDLRNSLFFESAIPLCVYHRAQTFKMNNGSIGIFLS